MTGEQFPADKQQEGPYDAYETSVVRDLINRLPHPIQHVRDQINDKLGAFSAALGDAYIPPAAQVEDHPAPTTTRRRPFKALGQFVGEFVDALQMEPEVELWQETSPAESTERPVPSQPAPSRLAGLAQILGIDTIRDGRQ